MKNPLRYLGFLSFLSLLYFVNGDVFYLWLMPFALYFTSHKKSDERLQKNTFLATRNAFFYTILTGGISLGYLGSIHDNSLFPLALMILFSGGIIIYVLSYFFYNFKEERP